MRDQHLADEARHLELARILGLAFPVGHPLLERHTRRAKVAHALAVHVEAARRFPVGQQKVTERPA